jgi:hypothetical protein
MNNTFSFYDLTVSIVNKKNLYLVFTRNIFIHLNNFDHYFRMKHQNNMFYEFAKILNNNTNNVKIAFKTIIII